MSLLHLLNTWTDRIAEDVARRSSRRAVISRLGTVLAGSVFAPLLLPVSRVHAQTKDPIPTQETAESGAGMDVAELSRQLTVLQDIEDIEQLMYEYCDIADDDHNQDRIVTIFAEDGIWEGEPHFARGHAEIRALFKSFAEQISFSQHNLFNPRIRVDGNTAHGTFNFLGPFTFREKGRRSWIVARANDDYVKVEGVWKIQHHGGFGIVVPYEKGWPSHIPTGVFGNQGWRGIPRTAEK